MKSWFLAAFILAFSCCTYSQFLARKNCLHPTIVKISESGHEVLSENDWLGLNDKDEIQVEYYSGNTVSKWYQLIFEADKQLSFKIWSDNLQSKYGFFIYKKGDGKFFCEDLSRGLVNPIEAIIYKEEISILGIGILPSVNAELLDTTKYNKSALFYDIPYKNAIQAVAGDTFYLNVYRHFGQDCGHHLWISSTTTTTKLRCINSACGEVKTHQRIKSTPFIDSTEFKLISYMKVLNKPKPFQVNFSSKDSSSGNGLSVQFYALQDKQLSNLLFETDEMGNLTTFIANDTAFLMHRMGYRPQTVFFKRNEPNFALELKKIEPGEQFILEHIYFSTNSSAILPVSKSEIQKLAEFMQENSTYVIEVQGHTNGHSRIKRDKYLKHQFHGSEKKLSRKRALAVKYELKEMGISSKRIKTKGYGGEKMLYPFPKNNMEHDRNKRVEVVVLK